MNRVYSKPILLFKITINLLLLILFVFLIVRQIEERILLKEYISGIIAENRISYPIDQNDLLTIRNTIEADIDCKSSEIASERPKRGWTVREILLKRKGLCGEASRLIYHILRQFDIPARRVYLHGNNTLHVVIEYFDERGNWVLLETINGPGARFKEILDQNNITLDSLFSYGPYRYHVTPKDNASVFGFNNFSYYPLNGLFNNKTFKTEIYVHKPLNVCFTFLSESHELMYLLILLVMAVMINLNYLVLSIKRLLSKTSIA